MIGGAEGSEVALDQSRHDAHQHLPADLADAACGEWRQRTERLDLVLAVQPVPRTVEDQDDPPLLRKGQPRDDRRRPAAVVLAGVDDHAAALEAGDADAGAAAARQQRRVAADIERQVVQRAQRRRDRKRDLRAGAEAGMARDRLLDHQTVAGTRMPRCSQSVARCAAGALAFRAFDDGLAAHATA